MSANNDRYYDELDDYGYGRSSRRNRDCDYDDHDFDFCDDGCDNHDDCGHNNCNNHNNCDCEDNLCGSREGGRGRNRDNNGNHDNDCDDGCSRNRCNDCDCDDGCGRNRCNDCDCDDGCGRNRCNDCDCNHGSDCHNNCNDDCDWDGCSSCNNNWNESAIHYSNWNDFNEDEQLGCCRTTDAANSEEGWFDHRTRTNRSRNRNRSEAECRFCRRLLCRIQVLDFALLEAIEYLNTHPCDCEALRYYRQIRRKLDRLECLYERRCGPLTNKGVETEYGWEWATCPWPWEGTV